MDDEYSLDEETINPTLCIETVKTSSYTHSKEISNESE
jgi:hypothetical protein